MTPRGQGRIEATIRLRMTMPLGSPCSAGIGPNAEAQPQSERKLRESRSPLSGSSYFARPDSWHLCDVLAEAITEAVWSNDEKDSE